MVRPPLSSYNELYGLEELLQDLMGEEDEEFRDAQATTSASFTGAEISDSRLVPDNDSYPAQDPGRTVC